MSALPIVDSLVPTASPSLSTALVVEPFLHFEPERIYNTLADTAMAHSEPLFPVLYDLREGRQTLEELDPALLGQLKSGGWVIAPTPNLGARFKLKYVSIEANTVCNQACYFCPVSTGMRKDHTMTLEFYEGIVAQVAKYREGLEGVSMIHYNEPTADKFFLERIEILKKYGLPVAVFTNGSGLTPQRIDAILAMGGLRYISINLSTLDRERYKHDRGGDHLPIVLRNLEYLRDKKIAPVMDMAVLGVGDEVHKADHAEISAHFAGSRFDIKFYEVMNRAGNVEVGHRLVMSSTQKLCGCEQTGSRPVQWVHVTPNGNCVLCCQDYHEEYVVGNLHHESLDEILVGPRMARLRSWIYGLEEAPADFMCRNCIYALTRH